jgi:hypothetical protein
MVENWWDRDYAPNAGKGRGCFQGDLEYVEERRLYMPSFVSPYLLIGRYRYCRPQRYLGTVRPIRLKGYRSFYYLTRTHLQIHTTFPLYPFVRFLLSLLTRHRLTSTYLILLSSTLTLTVLSPLLVHD